MTTPPEAQSLVKTNRSTIRDLLQGADFRREVARVLPRHLTAERFIRVALTATMRNPKLLECSRESLFKCLLDLSAIGLEPDGRRAHLIPFGKEVQLIIDYKGLAELVRRSGDVAVIHCDVVGTNDAFDYRFGTGAKLEHRPNIFDRGELYAAYSYVKLRDGTEEFDVMSIEEVERVRARSRAANDGPWKTDFNEMAKKTVFRRHSKWLPLSPETRAAIETDDEPLTEQERFQHAEPARVAEPPAAQVVAGVPFDPLKTERPPRRGRPPKSWSAPSSEPPESTNLEKDSPFKEPEPTINFGAEVEKKLKDDGETTERFLAVLRRNKIDVEEGTTLEAVPDEYLQMALDNWEDVQRHFLEMKQAEQAM